MTLSPDARTAIDGHLRLLLAWTTAINLTGIRDPTTAATAHVVDGLAAVPLLRALRVDRFLDLGSGGGMPGIPLAVALGVSAALVEPIVKKARFLAVATSAIGIGDGVAVDPRRAEALAADPVHRGRWPAVTARAVSSAADLVELAFPLLAPGGRLVAWKRGELDSELAAAGRAVDALGGGAIDVHPVPVAALASHRLVVIRRMGSVPSGFPRDPAVRRRDPW